MLLTKTTELAIQSLTYLAQAGAGTLVTPPRMADVLESSPSYMSKVLRHLAKADILTSRRGANGGFSLAREADQISLLDVVCACQGAVAGNYCSELATAQKTSLRTCGYHQAMIELQANVQEVLERWTIQDLLDAPPPGPRTQCKMRSILTRCG